MSSLKIRKVGNSLGVIFPKEIQDSLNIVEGDIIDVTSIENNKIIIEAHLQHHSKWKFSNTELSKEDNDWLNADLEDDNESPI